MKRVTGIGGVFFKSGDPEKLYKWYERNLDIKRENLEYGKFAWIRDPYGNRIELWEPPVGA